MRELDSGISLPDPLLSGKFTIKISEDKKPVIKTIPFRYYTILLFLPSHIIVETYYPLLSQKYTKNIFLISAPEFSSEFFNSMRTKIIICEPVPFNLFKPSTWIDKRKISYLYRHSTSPLFSTELKDWHEEILGAIRYEMMKKPLPDYFDEPDKVFGLLNSAVNKLDLKPKKK